MRLIQMVSLILSDDSMCGLHMCSQQIGLSGCKMAPSTCVFDIHMNA